MTTRHHPSDELLLDYSSGALGEAWSLAIATHAALCSQCRHSISFMENIGGSLLDEISPDAINPSDFDDLLSRLNTTADEEKVSSEEVPANTSRPMLPQPLRGYLGCDIDQLKWRPMGLGAYQIIIPTSETGVTARLLRIPKCRPVPEHSHGGLELTVLLAGAFSDSTGNYGRGDLQEADETLRHQPHAAPGEDCICLAITDAPLKFSSFAVRLVQPWLHI